MSICRDGKHKWQVVVDVCGPAAALEQFHKDHKPEDLPDGIRTGVRLLAPGEERVDPLAEFQKAEMAELKARFSGGGGASAHGAGQSSSEAGGSDVAE